MKGKQLLSMFLFSSLCTGFALHAQHVKQNAQPIDVSGYSDIRFNMDVTTEAQRDAINKERHAFLLKRDPEYFNKRAAYERMIQDHIAQNPDEQRSMAGPIVVPVVIHVVYTSSNPAGNISDVQAKSQITVLNQDYGRTNPDAANTPAVWKPVSVNMGIQFCLATKDPNGAVTTGIERKLSTTTSWSSNDAVKHASSGGLDAWDPSKYLNIWVCDLGGGLLGYGEFPTGSVSQTFGVVILNSAFGNTGTVASPYQLGRTTTHEFSHCFNLYHIWGDDGTACTGTDQCADTPNQAGSTTNCPTFPFKDACASSPSPNAGDPTNGIMFMNYMDYSYDNCMNMFTANQAARSIAVLKTAPYNALATSTGCPASTNNDAGISAITTPAGTLCTTTFVPVVVLKNFGANALTSCTVNYKLDAGTAATFSYTGNLASGATANVTLPGMTSTNGAHTFKAWTSLPNGVTDTQTSNDSSSASFTIAGGAGVAMPYSQGFETTTFVPAGWTLNNPGSDTTWARTTKAFKTGTASAMMNNFSYNNGTGKIDEMVMQGINLTSSPGPILTFQVAYTYYNQTTGTSPGLYTDSLAVLISTDCGSTWTSIYKKGGATLSTATPTANATTAFVPTAAQWRLESIPLSSYGSSNNAIIKFRNISDNGDNLYIDDINISSITAIKDVQLNSALNIYPNPTNGQLSVQLNMPVSGNFQVRIYDVMGRTITTLAETNSLGGTYNMDLSQNPNGLYFVEVITDGSTVTRKVLLDKK